jgi:hypothetical protein
MVHHSSYPSNCDVFDKKQCRNDVHLLKLDEPFPPRTTDDFFEVQCLDIATSVAESILDSNVEADTGDCHVTSVAESILDSNVEADTGDCHGTRQLKYPTHGQFQWRYPSLSQPSMLVQQRQAYSEWLRTIGVICTNAAIPASMTRTAEFEAHHISRALLSKPTSSPESPQVEGRHVNDIALSSLHPSKIDESKLFTTPCWHGKNCHLQSRGLCTFYHAAYENLSITSPCGNGNGRRECKGGTACKFFQKGRCSFFHPSLNVQIMGI